MDSRIDGRHTTGHRFQVCGREISTAAGSSRSRAAAQRRGRNHGRPRSRSRRCPQGPHRGRNPGKTLSDYLHSKDLRGCLRRRFDGDHGVAFTVAWTNFDALAAADADDISRQRHRRAVQRRRLLAVADRDRARLVGKDGHASETILNLSRGHAVGHAHHRRGIGTWRGARVAHGVVRRQLPRARRRVGARLFGIVRDDGMNRIVARGARSRRGAGSLVLILCGIVRDDRMNRIVARGARGRRARNRFDVGGCLSDDALAK